MVDQLTTTSEITEPGTHSELTAQTFKDEQFDLAVRSTTSNVPSFSLPPSHNDIVGAWWNQETLLGDLKSFLTEQAAFSGEAPDPDFNPHSYYAANKELYLDVVPFLDQGFFDHVRGVRQFDAVAHSIRTETKNRKLMSQGSGFDSIFGVGASLLDPSTFIPIFGWGMRGGKLAKGAIVAAGTGGFVSGEELLHHQQQRARTQYESMMGIGIATGLGGTLGVLGATFSRKGKLLNSEHPSNPLHERNLGPDEAASEWNPHGDRSVSEEMAENGTGRMSYNPETGVQLELFPSLPKEDGGPSITPLFDQAETITPTSTRLDRAVDWTQGKIGFTRSPVTVAMHTASTKATALLNSMAEMGFHTVEMAKGATRKISAELHKDITVYAKQQGAEDSLIEAWYQVMRDLGGVSGRSEVTAKGYSDLREVWGTVRKGSIGQSAVGPQTLKGIPLPEFEYFVWRRLNGDSSPHPNAAVEKGVVAATKTYRSFTNEMFQRAVRTGLLSDKQKIENYFPQIWNNDFITENGRALKEAFKVKFSGRFKDDPNGVKLDTLADELVEKLTNRNDVDITDGLHKGGSFILKKSGRMEARDLFITVDELSMFQDFLHKDVTRVMKHYADDMGGRITLREYYGKVDPEKTTKGGRDKASMDDLSDHWKEIQKEFVELRKAARAKGESVEKLNRDESHVADAIINLRDRLLATDRRPSAEGWGSGALYAGRMARKVNYLRYMGSVMLASLTDAGTISLSHGAGKHLAQLGRNFGRIATEAKSMKNRELAFLLYGAEGALSQSRTAKLVGVDDAMHHLGFGTGKTKKVSGAVEGGMNWLSSKMNIVNLMHYWNSRHKFISGHVVLGNLLDDAAKVAGGGSGTYRWRELGISDETMTQIDRLVKKHGFEETRGGTSFRWPDIDKWHLEAGGAEIKELLHVALRRAVDRAVITPGIADLPMFHSKELGQLLFQFNSFGFSAVNKFVRNLSHSAVNGRGLDALIASTWMLGMGTMAFSIREGIVKGRFGDGTMPDEDEWGTWVYESIDRSGLMMWMMPYINAGMKLAAGPLADAGVPIAAPSRFAGQHWAQQLFGPTFGGLGGDITKMTYDLSQGEIDKFATKGKRLIPFRNVFYVSLLHRLAWGEK